MNQKLPFSRILTSQLILALALAGCTKERPAALPVDAQPSIFSIAEFGDLKNENYSMSVETEDRTTKLSFGEAAKASAEKGLVGITSAHVPKRLQFMFNDFEMTGQADHSYPVALSVDKQFVTAYKIIKETAELSLLEKQLLQLKEEVLLQKQLQKTKNKAETKKIQAQLAEVNAKKSAALSQKNAVVLVPLFKYKIESYGVLEKKKNDLNEDTSELQLKATDWAEATHIQISIKESDRLPVGLDPSSQEALDRTFVMDRINNKVMTAATLKDELQIPLNVNDNTRILTLLDVDSLHVFEITQSDKTELTAEQLQKLNQGHSENVKRCSEEIKKTLPVEEQNNCILILRYDVPIKFVSPELPAVDHFGNQDSKIDFKEVRAGDNVGLVQIDKNVVPEKIESNNLIDPQTMIRVADIKNKEFFFKRTMEDAPVSTAFPPGMAGALTIIKFELAANRLIVRKADNLVEFQTGSNDTDYEELMSIPVKYLKQATKDSAGSKYSVARLEAATNKDADYVELDWSSNTISSKHSPYGTIQIECINSIADTQVSDVDMRLEQGVLNFTFNYTANLADECIVPYYPADDYNGNPVFQTTARLKERVSFKFNDGKTDQTFVNKIPFRAQNELGYGVWTIGKLTPNAQGTTGRAGQESNLPVVQDFRDGKILTYTVTGLEPSVKLEPEIRQLYKDTVRDVVNAWDFAYHQVFKGTPQERAGRYVDIQFAGENNLTAKVGDLDKNIIHFENKFNGNHGVLGVSQVGYNPRSGIIVADALVIYAGNLQNYVARSQSNLKLIQTWNDRKEAFKKEAIQELTNSKSTQTPGAQSQAADGSAKASATFGRKALEQLSNQKSFAGFNKLKRETPDFPQVNAKSLRQNIDLTGLLTHLRNLKSMGTQKFEGQTPNLPGVWIDRVLKKMSTNRQMDLQELEGLVAKEMLAANANKISPADQAQLERRVRLAQIHQKINNVLKNKPGCMLASNEVITREFTNKPFTEALRSALFFDIGHEMGHSQGLTHNFIGSFDKANFNSEDGSPSKRNYSSIMDYITPAKLSWDGIGSYDIHALRASHLGLLEIKPKANLSDFNLSDKDLINGKYISVSTLQRLFAPNNDWRNFDSSEATELLKPYKYCTDIHVGLNPDCQRFDYGTSATELVENLIEEYEDNYIANYHSWDRNNFALEAAARAISISMDTMYQMRQFLDELFYIAATDPGAPNEADYRIAALKTYFFYNNVIRTPDSFFSYNDPRRFTAIPYSYPKRNEKGEPTGKSIPEIALVEKRSTTTIAANHYFIDTVGYENNKAMAMLLLSRRGYPAFKYEAANILFSYVDFENYFLGKTAATSLFGSMVNETMLGDLVPTFIDKKGQLRAIPQLETTVTPTMQVYAGISSILMLEAQNLNEQNNYANLFKVGSSLGEAPSDRTALSMLGVPENSKTRLSFWAIDNAVGAQTIMKVAANKYFYLKNEDGLIPLFEKLITVQFQNLMNKVDLSTGLDPIKKELIEKLSALNTNGDVIPLEKMQADPQNSKIDNLVEEIVGFNYDAIINTTEIMLKTMPPSQIEETELRNRRFAQMSPLNALMQKALISVLKKSGNEMAEKTKFEDYKVLDAYAQRILDPDSLMVSYGSILKNIQFLNQLTLVTNPEYSR